MKRKCNEVKKDQLINSKYNKLYYIIIIILQRQDAKEIDGVLIVTIRMGMCNADYCTYYAYVSLITQLLSEVQQHMRH